MVRITALKQCTNQKGEAFIALELQSDLVMVQSAETGRWYATTKKASITSTFDEQTAKAMIGKEVPGRIEKVACEPYEYEVESGEVITLNHRWEYVPEGEPTPLRVVHKGLAA